MKKSILVTGGAGFIGANLSKYLVDDPNVSLIRIVDNFANSQISNISNLLNNPKVEFIEGDIVDYDFCMKITKGIDRISHQAALGSVPRSFSDPMTSTQVNILGTVNMLHASHVNGVERVILACSSSTYGDSNVMPRVEDLIGTPLSPYAITKYAVELYSQVFYKIYNLNFIGLRYFNVFGPLQKTDSQYAAVIPKFCKSILNDEVPSIFGDGETTRDFTYVDNIVLANHLALFTENKFALNQIYNVGCGEKISLNNVIAMLQKITGKNINPKYYEERKGDVKESMADISKIKKMLNYSPVINFEQGLIKTFNFYKNV